MTGSDVGQLTRSFIQLQGTLRIALVKFDLIAVPPWGNFWTRFPTAVLVPVPSLSPSLLSYLDSYR